MQNMQHGPKIIQHEASETISMAWKRISWFSYFSARSISVSVWSLYYRRHFQPVMAALSMRSRCGHYIFALRFLLSSSSSIFFLRLFSAVEDWMSTILPHMVWLYCEFRMHVWNVLHAARWKCRTQKIAKIRHLGTIARFCRAISSQLRHLSTIGKEVDKKHYLPHLTLQYGELRPTNGWDLLASLGQLS